MIITKNIEVIVGTKTFKHFQELGYNVKNGCTLNIPVEHLNKGSHLKIESKCDICGIIKTLKFQDYNKNISKYKFYSCSRKCAQQKTESTNLEKYGVKNVLENDLIKSKIKETNIKNYGVDNPSKSGIVKQIKKDTNIKNSGFDNPMKNKLTIEKAQNTNTKKYGGKSPLCDKGILKKSEKTCIKRYGVKNAMQNTDVILKNKKSNYNLKEYVFPSGKKVSIQGYENRAIDLLLKSHNENDIVVRDKNIEEFIGKIWYIGEDNKLHRYFPDIFIISENKIIEVKSDWTFNLHKKMNLLKRESCINNGINFEFFIFNKKQRVELSTLQ